MQQRITEDRIETLVGDIIIVSYVRKTHNDNTLVRVEHLNSEKQLHSPYDPDGTEEEYKPAVIEYDYGKITYKIWYQNGKNHRDGDLPAKIGYYENGNISFEKWYKDDKLHRISDGEDKPAYVSYYENGNIQSKSWYQNGKIHRENAPAFIIYNDKNLIIEEKWYQNGKLHRSPLNLCSLLPKKGEEIKHLPAHTTYNPYGYIRNELYAMNGIYYDPYVRMQYLNAYFNSLTEDEFEKIIKVANLIKN